MSLAILFHFLCAQRVSDINPLTPNDHYSDRAAPLTSKRCILYIYSTNTGTEYFNHDIYSLNGRLTGLVIFCVGTAFYSGLLKER